MRKLTASDGIKFSELDFSLIPVYVNEAIAALESSDDLQCDGISGYWVDLTGNPAVAKHSFGLQSKTGSEMTTKNGRLATQTNYYEFEFEGDAEGNLPYNE